MADQPERETWKLALLSMLIIALLGACGPDAEEVPSSRPQRPIAPCDLRLEIDADTSRSEIAATVRRLERLRFVESAVFLTAKQVRETFEAIYDQSSPPPELADLPADIFEPGAIEIVVRGATLSSTMQRIASKRLPIVGSTPCSEIYVSGSGK